MPLEIDTQKAADRRSHRQTENYPTYEARIPSSRAVLCRAPKIHRAVGLAFLSRGHRQNRSTRGTGKSMIAFQYAPTEAAFADVSIDSRMHATVRPFFG